MADIRLYSFDHQSLKVVGKKDSKTATGRFKHHFDSVDECIQHVNFLVTVLKVPCNQYVIVEYYEYMRSRIVQVIDSEPLKLYQNL